MRVETGINEKSLFTWTVFYSQGELNTSLAQKNDTSTRHNPVPP